MTTWFNELEECSVATQAAAKRAAASNENIWELPSGRFCAIALGLVVPPGSTLVAKRYGAGWKKVNEY